MKVSAVQARTGRTASMSAGSPPSMRRSRPASAYAVVRPTGQSIIRTPPAAIAAPTRRVVSGSIVLMST